MFNLNNIFSNSNLYSRLDLCNNIINNSRFSIIIQDNSNLFFENEVSNNILNREIERLNRSIEISNIDIHNIVIDNSENSLINHLRNIISNNNSLNNLFNLNLENYDSDLLNNILNNSFNNDKKKFIKVINDEELLKLKIIKYVDIEENTKYNIKSCPITLENFSNNCEIIKLPCNHIFSKEGIIHWLTKEKNSCPICRYEFNYKEIEKSNEDEIENTNNFQEPFLSNFINNEELLFQSILLESYNSNID